MPAFMAFFTGVVNAVELITATAIPFAFAEMAALVALTISGTLEFAEPTKEGLGIPSSAAASCSPYWVGTKNGLVVTWLTKVNFHGGVDGKFPAAELAGLLAVPPLLLVEEQAASSPPQAVAPDRRTAQTSVQRTGPLAGVSAHTVERYGVVTPKARSLDHGRQRELRQVS